MPVADYVEGLAWALPTFGCVLAAAWLFARGRGVVAFGVCATAGLVAVHLVPGAVGGLARGSVLLASVVLLLFAWFGRSFSRGSIRPTRSRSPRDAAWWVAAVVVVASAACALAFVWVFAGEPITGLDLLTFHLPNVARWIQSGSLWQIDQFVPQQAHGYYPHNGDLVLLAAVLPWHDDWLVRFVDVPFLALLGLAVYGIAVELRAPRSGAVLAAALIVSLPIVVKPALGNALPDTILLAMFAAGVLFLLRGELVLAGVGLGLAFGTKWYGVSSVVVLLLVWVIARRPPARDVLKVGGLVALFGGFWLLRNWVEAGNPVFPVEVPLLFDAPPDPVRAFAGASISDYLLDDWSVVDTYLIPSWRFALSWGGPVLLVASLVALWFARVRWLAVTVVALMFVYAITPYTALGPPGRPVDAAVNVRYLMPALVIAAPLLAWLLGRLRGWWLVVAEVVLGLAILRTLSKAYDVGAGRVVVAALVIVAVVAAVRLLPRAVVLAGAAVLAVAALVAGQVVQDEHNTGRYRGGEPVIDALTRLPPGTRVGLANRWSNQGVSPVLPAFGARLENRVEYLGPFVDGMLQREDDAARFVVRARAVDAVVVGSGAAPAPRVEEEDWLREAGWKLVAQDPRLVLYAAPPR